MSKPKKTECRLTANALYSGPSTNDPSLQRPLSNTTQKFVTDFFPFTFSVFSPSVQRPLSVPTSDWPLRGLKRLFPIVRKKKSRTHASYCSVEQLTSSRTHATPCLFLIRKSRAKSRKEYRYFQFLRCRLAIALGVELMFTIKLRLQQLISVSSYLWTLLIILLSSSCVVFN